MKTSYNRVWKILEGGIIHLFLSLTAVACLFPLFWMFRSSLMSLDTIFSDKSLIPSTLKFSNYVTAWVDGGFSVYLLNSVIYTVTVVLGIVFISSLAAFAFSRLRFPGRKVFFIIFLTAMMIPLPGSFVPLFVLMVKIGFVNHQWMWVRQLGYILCMINVGLPMSIFLLKIFFDKMSPDFEDAARIDGCNKLEIWWHIALPLSRPALAVIVIFNSLHVWNEYILAQLLLNEQSLMPLQIGLMKFQGAHSVDYPVLMAGLTIAAVPIILVYLIMQRHIMKGFSYGVTGG
jgi:raffinose/stachyose/melibiose transport system permease protein